MKKKISIIIYMLIFSVSFTNITFSNEKYEKEKQIEIKNRASIASFNVLRLGKVEKDYEYLAKCIKAFDIVGLVEVMEINGLYKLISELEKIGDEKWGYVISPYPVGTDTYKEYYAYVYKKNKVKYIMAEGFYPDEKDEFIREPFGATFKINNFDFTYVLFHTIYGKKVSQRQFEVSKLNDVYNYFQNLTMEENDVILGGDFNLSANDTAFENLLEHEDNIVYSIEPGIKTTIGIKGLANSYDNIFLSKKYTKEFKGESGALDITNGYYKQTRKEISDHLPVFIMVDTEYDDD